MKYYIECTYCGYGWVAAFYNKSYLASTTCSKCNDKHLKIKGLEDVKIDYYVGCPPFPEPKRNNEDSTQPFITFDDYIKAYGSD